MIVFSLQKNKLWNGSGFVAKPGFLELSSLCFAEQILKIGSGKYKIKIIGSSISGNGLVSVRIQLGDKDIASKTISLNSKTNTESSFDLELTSPGPYKIKLIRGKESIGRVSISLINFFKIIEKKEETISHNLKGSFQNEEKTFFIIDYDQLNSYQEISSLFLNLKNCFFLLKTSQSFIEKSKDSNFRFFFEWEDLFDYLVISNSKKISYFESNLNKNIFFKYNWNIANTNLVKLENKNISKITGIIF